MRPGAFAAFAIAILLAGCLRVGEGDDLYLVCEEKSGSPRKAYDVGFLVAQTTVEGELDGTDKVALLEAARHHVITMGGRPHAGFHARLVAQNDSMWHFEATGIREDAEPDLYEVELSLESGARAVGAIDAPRSIRDVAWRAANASGQGQGEPTMTWDAALPSCVTARFEARILTVNVVQERVVYVDELR